MRKGDLQLSCSKRHNPTFPTKKKRNKDKTKIKKKKWKASLISASICSFVYLLTNEVISIFFKRDYSFSSFTAWEIVR